MDLTNIWKVKLIGLGDGLDSEIQREEKSDFQS